MKIHFRFLLFSMIGIFVGCGSIDSTEVVAPPQPATTTGSGTVDLSGEATFSGTVQPILLANCSACHNSTSLTGGLDVTTYSGLVEQTDVVVPGDPDESKLIQFLEGGIMPPPGNPAPSDEEIAAIRAWVGAGALDD
ncbi:MAG TPA: c-type cytochrome domain-containing protein [Bdellovibrionota bacterium]|nr:c-type cytochrome domain-containing protein [Bdellovibrionota bacterium]